jgi:hypothetical protein
MTDGSNLMPKSEWGDGPWQYEPDELRWSVGDVPCALIRNMAMGHWCG